MSAGDRPELRDFIDLHSALLDTRLMQQSTQLREHLDVKLEYLAADLGRRMVDERLELLRWIFLVWISIIVPLACLLIVLRRS